MVDVDVIPKVRCDNCGFTAEKASSGTGASRSYARPSAWGCISAVGGRSLGAYGEKERIAFPDLCSGCANAALGAAADALRKCRSEKASVPEGHS